ncbi:MAG: AAA family ATPase [Clostridia bacterium]|nr:AAA family ATPase [Clostridia bacterium]
MKIKKIRIDEYGGLSDLTVTPDRGINIIKGGNESGKSTLMSFISFIFYGLPPKRGDALTERGRALSWTGGRAAGSIELETDGGAEYRVSRSCLSTGLQNSVTESYQITDLSTGTEAFRGRYPWEVFLGVSQQVFESVTSVKQLGASRLAGDELGSALENILFSADESVNTERALRRLNQARVSLMPQRGPGGRIADLTKARDQLRERLARAESNSSSILTLRSTVDKYRKVTSDLRYRLDSAKNACGAYETYRLLERFDLLHSGEKRLAELVEAERKLAEESGKDGALPDREYVGRLDDLARRLGMSESELAVLGAGAAEVRSEASGDPLKAEAADRIAESGGAGPVLDEYRKKTARGRRRLIAGIILSVAGALAAAGSMLLYFLKPGPPFPKLDGSVSWALTVAGIAALFAGILLLRSRGSAKKKASAVLSGFGFEPSGRYRDDLSRFPAYAAECDAERVLRDGHRKELDALLADLDSKRRETDALRVKCLYELAAFGFCRTPEEVIAENEQPSSFTAGVKRATREPMTDAEIMEEATGGRPLGELLVESARSASETTLKHEKILSDIERYSEAVKTGSAALEGYSESEMRARLSAETVAFLKKADPAQLRFERDSVAAQLESARNKLTEAEKNLAVAEHIYENPARLAVELDGAEEELDRARRLCGALMLASNSISEAGDRLKRSITPRLRKRAGEILSGLTGGKYSDIGIGEDFSVTVSTPSGTHPVQLMSGGTKDICYLSLRLALAELIFRGSLPPLLLDETAAQLDDGRAAGLLSVLGKLAESGVQSVFFTCHSREPALLDSLGIGYMLTEL